MPLPADGAAARPPAPQPALRFGPFVLDVAQARLTRDGLPLVLRPKAFELLAVLAGRCGALVTKDELLDAVWGRRFITEGVVKSTVAELRGVLGDDAKSPQWIETVARRGYRFASPVEVGTPSPAALPQGAPARGNALDPVAVLVGRDADLAMLSSLLATSRLLTIAGPSGIGKTSLALAFASSARAAWPDGVWCVELAALSAESTTAASLVAVFAQALRLDAAIVGDAALARALRPLQMLIVVDNAERVLAPLAALLAPLLVQAPRLRVLVTSQEPLRVAGEQVYRIAPLALPPPGADGDPQRLLASAAVQFFVERVAARLPGFRFEPQQAAVAAICRALDGLPLALELAAARVQLLGVQGIAKMLLGDEEEGAADPGARLRLLAQGARDAVPRQRTLRDALTWSHDLLDAPQRRVFRRLGVFRGGFTLALAQAVVGDADLDDWAVLEALQALVEKSLLVAAPPIDPAVPPRFIMLESLRSFALERLAEAGETAVIRWRHLQAVLGHWQRADARSISDPVLNWLALNRPEVDNLRAALRWALADDAALARAAAAAAAATPDATPAARCPSAADAALALVVAAGSVWYRGGLGTEGREACERVRARAAVTGDGRLRGGFHLTVAALGCYANAYRPAEGLAAAQAAALAFEADGDRVRAYFATHLEHQMNIRAGSADEKRAAVIVRLAALDDPAWDELLSRYLRHARAYEDRLAGRADAYRAFCRDERLRCVRLGAVAEGWAAAHGLMLAEHDRGDVAAALLAGRETLAEIRSAGRLGQHGALLALWATMLAQSGAPADARPALAEALPALRSAGTPWMLQVALAWLAASERRNEDAARLIGWHEAGRRERRVGEAGSTIAGALKALHALLRERLGAAASERLQVEGASLDDGAAERLAFGTESLPARRRAGAKPDRLNTDS